MTVSAPPYPDLDAIFCHCDLEPLQHLVLEIEGRYAIEITRQPSVCLTMIRAEDSLEHQPFYLGEALTTECEVVAGGATGYGICLGEEPSRAYCIAVLDAVREAGLETEMIERFATEHAAIIEERDRREFARVMTTKVDFKLLEQE